MIGEFSRTRQRETSEVQPEERLQREAEQANRQDDVARLQARNKGKAGAEDEALKPKLVGEDGRPRKKEVLNEEQMQAVTGGVLPEPKESVSPIAFNRMIAEKLFTKADQASQRGYTSLAETISENAMKHVERADQLEADTVAAGKKPMQPDPKPQLQHVYRSNREGSQSRSPEQVERPQSNASPESPGMRDVLRHHDAFSIVASPETSGLASQGATPLERRELNRLVVKEKHPIAFPFPKKDTFVKALEKVVDCISCNMEISSPRAAHDPELVKHHDEIDALAEKYYPEEWKNHPDYIRKQDQKALRGIQG